MSVRTALSASSRFGLELLSRDWTAAIVRLLSLSIQSTA
jgi:hypothetical protein